MEQYYVRFWCKNPDTGFVEKREEYFYAEGKRAHKKVRNWCCKMYHITHADIITIGCWC